MGLPQYIYLVLVLLSAGMVIERNGKAKTGEHSAVFDIISMGVSLYILHWGGFFG